MVASGCEKMVYDCEKPGRLVEFAWPSQEGPGVTGGGSEEGDDQHFFDLALHRFYEGHEDMGGRIYEAEVLGWDQLGAGLRTLWAVTPLA